MNDLLNDLLIGALLASVAFVFVPNVWSLRLLLTFGLIIMRAENRNNWRF